MGSGASAAEAARPDGDGSRANTTRAGTPSGHSHHTLQVDASPLDSHTVDVCSEQSEGEAVVELNEDSHTVEVTAEREELSLDFESFLHNNGTLYSCFSHHGNRVYMDETQKLQPFPSDWLAQGHFLSPPSQGSTGGVASSRAAVREDDRVGSVHVSGRGSLMTYMFEEKLNVCRFWEPEVGVWLLLPLQWELNLDLSREHVQRVMTSLPGLVDQKEIVAALRQCNYDAEEVVSTYLALFGEVLLQAPLQGGRSDLDSFRALLEGERLVEDLRQKLCVSQQEAEKLRRRNAQQALEVQHLSDLLQHQNQRLAELEADHQEAREKIRVLMSRRPPPPTPPPRTIHKPSVDVGQLQRVARLVRNLNVAHKQLGSSARQALGDLRLQLQRLQDAVLQVWEAELKVAREAEQLRLLYRKEAVERKSLYNQLLELQGNIRVFCRCRKGSGAESCLENAEEQEVVVVQRGSSKKFYFDKVFPPRSSQEEVFAETLPVITSCVDGYNVCILAYGQTGSGKTFTMMGTREEPGVNIRSIRELLRMCAEREKVSYTLQISMLEIYNDNLNDLLGRGSSAPLELKGRGKGVAVPGLSQVPVRTEADILAVMETGERNRKVASTKMNTHSSRSHLVVALEVQGSDEVSGLSSRGTLTLCDLAGSERIAKTEAQGARLVEAAAINKSLTALAQVFDALKSNALHVPFRNSKLTHLLQPCLSGDAKCCVFVNVSPDEADVGETVSTLQFGSSIRQVSLGRASQNIVPTRSSRAER